MQRHSPARALLALVLLVSCAHAFVHVYELSLPSVEQLIGQEYRPGDAAAGKQLSGRMANWWRMPFGFGALLAGWLVDRFGSRSMLAIYLLGCGLMCVVVSMTQSLSLLFGWMFLMGCFASIYHPAGLSLISHEATPQQLPRALGLHGIFGSLGIGGAPFLAGAVLSLSDPPSWRFYYVVLCVPGFVLGLVFVVLTFLKHRPVVVETGQIDDAARSVIVHDGAEDAHWFNFGVLTIFAVLMGFCYAGVVSFLPRYIDGAAITLPAMTSEGVRNYLSGGVLLVGCVGQYLAGRFARTDRLERQLTLIALGNIPGLAIMAVGSGWWRVVGAVLFALIHFMHQPIYNSLIAKYTPRSRRSLCYGLSFALGFGLGSFGARFAGYSTSELLTFGTLAGVAALSSILALLLWQWNRP